MTSANSQSHPQDLTLQLALEMERRRDAGEERWSMFSPLLKLLCDCGGAESRAEYWVYLKTLRVFIRQLAWERSQHIRTSEQWGDLTKFGIIRARYAIILLYLVGLRHAVSGKDERGTVGDILTRMKTALA